MNQLEYVPGIGGQSVQLDGPSSFVGIAENLRSREWEYDLGYRDLVSATRPAREVDVTFKADYQTADELRRVADADVTARTPGTFIAQKDWRQRGYILASQPNDIHYGRLSTELKIALLDGAWWRLVDKNFMPEDTTPTYRSATGKSVTTDGAANVPLHALTVDGEAVQNGTPTPSEPVDIQVVEGVNLLQSDATTKTVNGITFTVNADGSVTANGTATAGTVYDYHTLVSAGFLTIEPGTFVLSGCPSGGSNSTYKLDIETADGTYVADTGSGHSFTVSESTTFRRARIVICSGQTASNLTFKPQLEAGTTATPYVPYGSIGIVVGNTATSIPLQGNVLASLPDGTRDTVTVDGAGHCVLTKRVGYRTITSAETVYAYEAQSVGSRGYIIINDLNSQPLASGSTNGYANLGTFYRDVSIIGTTHFYTHSNRVYYVVEDSSVTTQELLLEWINSHSLTIAYPLTTPQTIDLDYIDMPNVFDGAVVSITAEVTPTITAEWQTSPDLYLDYPHDYPYDYQKTSSTGNITPSVLTPSDVYLAVFGPAVNPYVIVGGNRYQVNVTVPSGGYLVVDGRDKTIQLTLADGTVQNVFSSGVRGGGAGGGSYIFEKVPAGTSEVTYDGSFGFDLGWYEEEGEPPWSQS